MLLLYKFATRELKQEIIDKVNAECIEFEDANTEIMKKYTSILEDLEKKYL